MAIDPTAKVQLGFVSFTEVEAGAHDSYNEWHLFDHLPEQLPIGGVAWGQRWVLTPELAERAVLVAPLDRVHYVTLYLMAEPLAPTLARFQELAGELRKAGRFHEQRTSHLAGAFEVDAMAASPWALVSAEAIPYRPHRGVHVCVQPAVEAVDLAELLAIEGVAGAWSFKGDDLRITWCWLDGNLFGIDRALADVPAPGASFAATLQVIDPFAPFTWFD
jgi:hypothetical protein